MSADINRQQGVSLVELMIASALGIVLMAGVIQIFIGTKTSYLKTESIGKAQENGRFAMDALTRSARLAGYWDYSTSANGVAGAIPVPFIPPCAVVDGPCTQDGSGYNNSDRLAIQLDSPDNKDCNGNAPPLNRVIISVYWIQKDGFGTSSLYCRGYDPTADSWIGTSQPYVSGIDSLQILYGAQSAVGDRIHYVNASRVSDWSRVHAIKIAILSTSDQSSYSSLAERSYVLLDSAPLTFSDGQSRYIFSTTVFVANPGMGA